jgi:hypothetical protein
MKKIKETKHFKNSAEIPSQFCPAVCIFIRPFLSYDVAEESANREHRGGWFTRERILIEENPGTGSCRYIPQFLSVFICQLTTANDDRKNYRPLSVRWFWTPLGICFRLKIKNGGMDLGFSSAHSRSFLGAHYSPKSKTLVLYMVKKLYETWN